MTIRVQFGGALRTVSRIRVMMGGVLREVRTVRIMAGDQLRDVASFVQAMTASASPAFVSGYGQTDNRYTVARTDPATAQVNGGTPGYSYQWQLVSGDSAIKAASATSASTTFFASANSPRELNAVFRCTVSDSSGQNASADVSVNIVFEAGGFQP